MSFTFVLLLKGCNEQSFKLNQAIIIGLFGNVRLLSLSPPQSLCSTTASGKIPFTVRMKLHPECVTERKMCNDLNNKK